MNGVRRFLGGGLGTPSPTTQSLPPSGSPPPPDGPTTAPLSIGKPSWPPSPVRGSLDLPDSPKTTTAALFLRKDRQRLPPAPSNSNSNSGRSEEDAGRSSRDSNGSLRSQSQSVTRMASPVAGPSSPRAVPHRVSELSRKPVSGADLKRSSGSFNVRDDLLLDLLASEAIVDSRSYEILSAEEVEELKKEQQVMTSRLTAMSQRLKTAMKVRNAVQTLAKSNAPYKGVTKQTSEELDAANRRVDTTQTEVWRLTERASEIQRRLLEHRAGVLSHSVRSMEKKLAPPDEFGADSSTSGYSTPNRSSQMSPTGTSVTSIATASSKGRFDGAHFFAGHSDAIVPRVPRLPPSPSDIISLEENLKTTTEALEAAKMKQAEMARELAELRLDKEQMETTLTMGLQNAEDVIAELQREQEEWSKDRAELEERRREVDTLERRLELLEEQSGETTEIKTLLAQEREKRLELAAAKDKEIEELNVMHEADRAAWDVERETMQYAEQGQTQLDEHTRSLQALMQDYGIPLDTDDTSLPNLLVLLQNHFEDIHSQLEKQELNQRELSQEKAQLEESIRGHFQEREALSQQVDDLRRAKDAADLEIKGLEAQVRELSISRPASNQPVVEYKGDAAQIVAALQSVWAVLPSAEARASKLGTRGARTASPSASPVLGRTGGASISDMDVRSLKTLYDPKGFAMASSAAGTFSVESFAARVQALVADDRALIERLLRFAQAHDLLRKNAERAQKLAQDSSVALETYQKQVKTLEDRNMTLMSAQAALQDELQQLQEAVERIQAEKLEVEAHAAEQAEALAQLTDANNTLSARALTLANDAASTSDSVRRQMEAQLAECNMQLTKAKEEIEAMRSSQQTQQMALLEELNTVQTENTNLRTQLRKK